MLCCGYTLTNFPISTRLTSLALWQSNDCPSASKATLMNMDKYFVGIHYERLHSHNKAKHNKTVCIFLGIYCTLHACLCVFGKGVFELCIGFGLLNKYAYSHERLPVIRIVPELFLLKKPVSLSIETQFQVLRLHSPWWRHELETFSA